MEEHIVNIKLFQVSALCGSNGKEKPYSGELGYREKVSK